MAIELATNVGDLNETYPAAGEPVAQGDDHIRLIKAVLKTTFAALGTGPYTPPVSPIPTGTRMPFAQAAAPTGWTQDTSDNADNRMLRVVKTAGNGVAGTHSPILNNVVPAHTHGFTTGGVSADHTHAIGDPTHSHSYNFAGSGGGASFASQTTATPSGSITGGSLTGIWTAGMSANHTHSGSTDNGSSNTNWTPRYIDLIICAKD